MNFKSTVDELHHWLGLLQLDIMRGEAQRHLLAVKRLCWLLVDKLQAEREKAEREKSTPLLTEGEFTRLSLHLLDLQRQIEPKKPGPKEQVPRGPKLRLVVS
jgi:hypothetical protein